MICLLRRRNLAVVAVVVAVSHEEMRGEEMPESWKDEEEKEEE